MLSQRLSSPQESQFQLCAHPQSATFQCCTHRHLQRWENTIHTHWILHSPNYFFRKTVQGWIKFPSPNSCLLLQKLCSFDFIIFYLSVKGAQSLEALKNLGCKNPETTLIWKITISSQFTKPESYSLPQHHFTQSNIKYICQMIKLLEQKWQFTTYTP